MAKTSQRLKMVLKLAQLRQQHAAEQLAETIRQSGAQQQQAVQLQSYQQEYLRQFNGLDGQTLSPEKMRNFHNFFNGLETAMGTQQERVVLAQEQCENARGEWQKLYASAKNLEGLIERKLLIEEQEQEKKLQRELDDRYVAKQGRGEHR